MVLNIALAVLFLAVIFDLRSRQIPDALSVVLLCLGLASTAFHLDRVSWPDLGLGLLLGFGAGTLFFYLGGLGGGDVKLLSALGTVLGWKGELGVLFYMAIVGGVMAVIARFRKETEYAYAPAIALGLLAFMVRGHFA